MKNRKNNIFRALLLSLCVLAAALLACLPEVAQPANAETPAVGQELYYGRAHLDDERLIGAYDALCEGVGERSMIVSLHSFALTVEELDRAFTAYMHDHPEHYWLPQDYGYSLTPAEKITKLEFTHLTGFDDALFEAKAAEYLALAADKASDYDKALALHDALVSRVVYDSAAPNAHNAYGAIVDGRAVCEGYAESYQYLLQRCGIMCYSVVGQSHGRGTSGTSFAWTADTITPTSPGTTPSAPTMRISRYITRTSTLRPSISPRTIPPTIRTPYCPCPIPRQC